MKNRPCLGSNYLILSGWLVKTHWMGGQASSVYVTERLLEHLQYTVQNL
jgi:hypothetical protein